MTQHLEWNINLTDICSAVQSALPAGSGCDMKRKAGMIPAGNRVNCSLLRALVSCCCSISGRTCPSASAPADLYMHTHAHTVPAFHMTSIDLIQENSTLSHAWSKPSLPCMPVLNANIRLEKASRRCCLHLEEAIQGWLWTCSS